MIAVSIQTVKPKKRSFWLVIIFWIEDQRDDKLKRRKSKSRKKVTMEQKAFSVDYAQVTETPVSFPFLTPTECIDLRDKVLNMGPAWFPRNGHFFTLGYATYLDHRNYKNPVPGQSISERNLILRSVFADTYEKLTAVMESHFKKKVIYDESLPLPGFHVFTHLFGKSGFDYSHFDGQFYYLDWNRYQQVDFANPVSITVPIALPECGSGLDIWPETCQVEAKKDEGGNHFQSFSYSAPCGPVTDSTPCIYFPYDLGNLVMHSGMCRHAIHRNPPDSQPSFRITLQCHALRCDDQWVLYW
jgi:hypothetical protein